MDRIGRPLDEIEDIEVPAALIRLRREHLQGAVRDRDVEHRLDGGRDLQDLDAPVRLADRRAERPERDSRGGPARRAPEERDVGRVPLGAVGAAPLTTFVTSDMFEEADARATGVVTLVSGSTSTAVDAEGTSTAMRSCPSSARTNWRSEGLPPTSVRLICGTKSLGDPAAEGTS